MTKDKLYIEIAEAICLDAYKNKHKGLLPKLNIENEPKLFIDTTNAHFIN